MHKEQPRAPCPRLFFIVTHQLALVSPYPVAACSRRVGQRLLDQVTVGKRKRRVTAAEKAEKRRRKAAFQTVFVGGKMKRVRRPPMIDGIDADEFIRRNADPLFLHAMEMWWLLEEPDAPADADDEEPDVF
jgi:hypothetical protein